ncbi:uncharacterized protein LOC142336911 [Convolutriloba macropyga]|uniref:uncharacterized protein LOC142336911 n=1 Tax=Convolutriloba macropyga TaxID=536237 RepID=UPI003F52099E
MFFVSVCAIVFVASIIGRTSAENGNAAGGQKGGLFKTLYKDLGQMATDVKEGVKGFIDEKRPAAKEHRQGVNGSKVTMGDILVDAYDEASWIGHELKQGVNNLVNHEKAAIKHAKDPNNSEVGLGNVFMDAFDEVKKGLNNAQKGAEKLIMGTPAPTPVEASSEPEAMSEVV